MSLAYVKKCPANNPTLVNWYGVIAKTIGPLVTILTIKSVETKQLENHVNTNFKTLFFHEYVVVLFF